MRLWKAEQRAMLVVFDTILPSGAGAVADPRSQPRGGEISGPGARDVPLDRFLPVLMQRAPFQFAIGLRAALWLVLLCPLFIIGRPRTFLGLSREERTRVLDRLAASGVYALRELPNLLKMAACLGWGSHPAVRAHIGVAAPGDLPPAWLADAPVDGDPRAGRAGHTDGGGSP